MRAPNTAILTILCLGLGISQTFSTAASDEWQYEFTPYLFTSGLDGTMGVQGSTIDVDASFSDIVDHLDMGLMGMFSAQKGPWTFALDGSYSKLSGGGAHFVTGPDGIVSHSGTLDVTNKMYIAQGTVGYRLLDDNTKLDVIGGLRYTKLKVEVDIVVDFTPPAFGGARGADGSNSWVDGVVGFRVIHPVSNEVSLVGYGDIGAGGSDLTYQLMGGVNWEFKDDFVAKVGYRYLYWDYEDGGALWDMAMHGPYLGLGIRF